MRGSPNVTQSWAVPDTGLGKMGKRQVDAGCRDPILTKKHAIAVQGNLRQHLVQCREVM